MHLRETLIQAAKLAAAKKDAEEHKLRLAQAQALQQAATADPLAMKLQEVVNQIQKADHLTAEEKARFVESLYEQEDGDATEVTGFKVPFFELSMTGNAIRRRPTRHGATCRLG